MIHLNPVLAVLAFTLLIGLSPNPANAALINGSFTGVTTLALPSPLPFTSPSPVSGTFSFDTDALTPSSGGTYGAVGSSVFSYNISALGSTFTGSAPILSLILSTPGANDRVALSADGPGLGVFELHVESLLSLFSDIDHPDSLNFALASADMISSLSGGSIVNGAGVAVFALTSYTLQSAQDDVSSVPLPAALPMFGVGILALAGVRRIRKKGFEC